MTSPTTPPGWYPDPAGGQVRRYWDGQAWGPFEPQPSNTPPGWYADPAGSGGRRYRDGGGWGPVEPVASPAPADMPALSSPAAHPQIATVAGLVDGPTGSPAALQKAPLPVVAWWVKSSTRQKGIAVGSATAVVAGLVALGVTTARHNTACMPAAPNPTRKDFVQENVLKDSLSDTWNKAGGIGEEVRDGDLAFVVSSIEICNNGYAKVAMTVTNTDKIANNFNPKYQRLLRDLPPPTGTIPKGGFECQLCDGIGDAVRINPGDTIATVVPFAIKGDPAIMAVELHDSSLSFGVKVYP